MVVIVTRDVADRFRGFLGSCMLEIAPGVYTSPRMNPGVRDRVWTVLSDWFGSKPGGSIVMTWRDPGETSGQGVACLGTPPVQITDADGVYVASRDTNIMSL
jgi:CRISPR-associated protein Cas2